MMLFQLTKLFSFFGSTMVGAASSSYSLARQMGYQFCQCIWWESLKSLKIPMGKRKAGRTDNVRITKSIFVNKHWYRNRHKIKPLMIFGQLTKLFSLFGTKLGGTVSSPNSLAKGQVANAGYVYGGKSLAGSKCRWE